MANQSTLPPADLQRQWLAKTLLHGRLTRSQVSQAFGVTAPAVTRHARWLLDRALVRGDRVRMPNIKRPVEVFRLEGASGTSLVLAMRATGITAELVAADAQSLWSVDVAADQPTQIDLMGAMRRAITQGREQARVMGRTIDLVGLSVSGYVEHDWGMVFGVRGVSDWEPCMPVEVLGELPGIPGVPGVPVRAWTQTASKIEGLSVQLQRDGQIGYIDRAASGLAIASMDRGKLVQGRFGTASSAVHQQVSDDPSVCYCGRRGCLDLHLRRGDASDEMLLPALPGLLKQMGVTWLGVEWPGEPRRLHAVCAAAGVDHVEMIGDAQTLAATGARHRCTRLLLGLILDKLHPRVAREVVNPAALRKPLPVVSR